jgi:ATP-binding cassette subfamily B multidrug efflux pump
MKNLFTLYKRVWRTPLASGLALLFVVLDVGINLILPYIMKDVVNYAIANKDLSYALKRSIIMLAIVFVAIICIVLNNLFSQYVSQKVTEEIRNEAFTKIQYLSFNNVDKLTTGRLISTITSDCNQIQQILAMSFRILIRAPLFLIGGLIMAFITSPNLFFIVLVAVPILIIGAGIIMANASKHFRRVQIELDTLNNRLLENVSAAREIKTFVSEEVELTKFEKVNKDYTDVNIKVGKVMAFADPLISIVTSLAIAGIIYYGAYLLTGTEPVLEGVGDIMASISYVNNVLFGLIMVAMLLIHVSRAEVSARRINELFLEKIDLINDPNAIVDFEVNGEIEFKDVSFAYQDEESSNENCTLRNINVHIKPNEVVGIIGSTGSGKTTLVQLIPRLYDVTKGELLIDGINIKNYDINELRKQIAFVTQESILFSGTISSNIRQGKEDASIDEMEEAATYAAARNFIQERDNQYESEVLQQGTNLSGGQRQRVSLARAFVRQPKILILDDSTSAVDAKSEALIKDSINKLSKQMTTIIIAQKISTVKDLDKIIVLNNRGQVDGFGTHKELLKTSQVYREIYNSQFGGVDNE